MAFLAPLDPLVWDRELLRQLGKATGDVGLAILFYGGSDGDHGAVERR